MLRVTFEAGVDDLRNVWIGFEVAGDDACTALDGFHTDLQSLDASEQHVTVEWTEVSSQSCFKGDYSCR
jgi:hypothetical protein